MSSRCAACVVSVALAAALVGLPADSRGCAVAPRAADDVAVADETAVIIWDEAARVEHFIRRANFVSSGYDFGFLVPTPTKPDLHPADPVVFSDLAAITKPKTEYREESRVHFGCGPGTREMSFKAEAEPPAGAVLVLEQKTVGDLDAVVLGFRPGGGAGPKEAAAELLVWLNRNQYAVRPDLEEWLVPYIRDRWVITAFKIAAAPVAGPQRAPKGTARSVEPAEPGGISLQATTVRMTFATDRPFYPYREPAAQRAETGPWNPRLLRVYLAAKQRMAGKLGDGTRPWAGRTVWANALLDEEKLALQRRVDPKADAAPGYWWLTEFEDTSSPRPGTAEVYFEPAADPSAVARPPHVIINYREPGWVGPVFIGVPVLLAVGLALLIGYQLRRIQAVPPEDRPPPGD